VVVRTVRSAGSAAANLTVTAAVDPARLGAPVHVLVLGATGYVGGRLVPELLAAGHRVRCAARTPAKLDGRSWRDRVEVVAADATDRASMEAACAGVDAVMFLVHAMDGAPDFAEREAAAARTVRDAAAAAGVGRIVYLGGLGDEADALSTHLRSRQAVGRILAEGPVPVTELRAGVVIGSGSVSFEMLRHLTEVLPVMTTPRWVDTRTQPIAVRDVLRYLVGVLDVPESAGRVLEIGGPDVLTYREMMHHYAAVAGLRRRVIIPVPVLSPRLSSLWVGLVTPLPTGTARPLVDSLVNEVVVRDDAAERLMPFERTSFDDAVRLALRRIQDLDVATTWASAGGGDRVPFDLAATPDPQDPAWAGGTLLEDLRRTRCDASPAALYDAVTSLGGDRGYHTPRFLWVLRGGIDKMVGGVGLGRGRRHPQQLAVGEPVDFWRVEALRRPGSDGPDGLLRLRAEMKVPGEAWLEYRIRPDDDGAVLEQHARFAPRGLWGRAYWYVLVPVHAFMFPRMARRIARDAEALARRA
jgi:uncharacterized protein YbjT (DUF2867 family)